MKAPESIQLTIALGCVIYNRELLLIRRCEPEQPVLHGFYELPGGKVEPGEELEACVVREIAEETGNQVFVVSTFPFLFEAERHYKDRDVNVIAHCFRCELEGEPKTEAAGKKISEVKWVPINQLDSKCIQAGSLRFILYVMKQEYPEEAKSLLCRATSVADAFPAKQDTQQAVPKCH